MPQINWTNVKDQDHEKSVKAKILTFLMKLAEDDTAVGLHIEKMQNSADSRARTARVDQSLRAVLYRLDVPGGDRTYVYAGTWPHDTAIERARTRILHTNPVNNVAEFIRATMPEPAHAGVPQPSWERPSTGAVSFLAECAYLPSELTDGLGFDQPTADRLFAATSADELLGLAETFENQWQSNAVIALAVNDPVAKIRTDLGFDQNTGADDTLVANEDEKLVRALDHPAARMQFAYIENEEELRRVIEDGDFGAWRVFLHPEQRAYAEKDYNGSFRLSGGAGTGKTVVLLHRAARLSKTKPGSRIVLTTFTKTLSAALERDLERLDPSAPRASVLGESGVLVRGVDQLAVAVRDMAGADFWKAATAIFGEEIEPRANLDSSDKSWYDAIDGVKDDLPEALRNPAFFEGEYLQVILPNRITSKEGYLKVRRPGRGVALDRRKRVTVWKAVESYRQTATRMGRLSFAEMSAVAASYLESNPGQRVADYVLIDEAQDLSPLHWQLLRSLVPVGKNDLFISEDTHQRIYGQHVVLSRYGIKITGRSRRLTLNYRTTQQNLNYALGFLDGGAFVDSEEAREDNRGYRSSRTGPQPRSLTALTKEEQYSNVAEVLQEWLTDDDIRPETIAILTRTNSQAKEVRNQLAAFGVTVVETHTGETIGKSPLVLTMHKSKGLEFSRVVLFDVSDGMIPPTWLMKDVAHEEVADVHLRERSLLYVAASRARDELVVSFHGRQSELLGAHISVSEL